MFTFFWEFFLCLIFQLKEIFQVFFIVFFFFLRYLQQDIWWSETRGIKEKHRFTPISERFSSLMLFWRLLHVCSKSLCDIDMGLEENDVTLKFQTLTFNTDCRLLFHFKKVHFNILICLKARFPCYRLFEIVGILLFTWQNLHFYPHNTLNNFTSSSFS